MSSSLTTSTLSLETHLTSSPSEQLCYVHCNICDTVLAVSVPYSSLFKTVTVRCGHCSNLLSVNMRALHMQPPPPPPNPLNFANNTAFFQTNLLEEITTCSAPSPAAASAPSASSVAPAPPSSFDNHQHQTSTAKETTLRSRRSEDFIQQSLSVNKPPEKRQRVPSAYNRFIKDEIQRIKAGNPEITHREAFSAAAKNWAYFPHIHFGLMPDHQGGGLKKNNNNIRHKVKDDATADHDVMLKDGLYVTAASANMGVTPF
ncbi:Protein YABBY 4 [Zostera marina]|uniref:Protein YABBY 4 n=1 Tax=Zostera marina TaxID=29655 RepID=A0A0K9Q584_ZOSMR|nr:Protein YABBY 4 [Zostera marina]